MGESDERAASEAPGADELLCFFVVRQHPPIEAVTGFAMSRIAASLRCKLPGSRSDDIAPSDMDGDVEAQIGAVHDQAPPAALAAKGSTNLWIG